VRIPVANRFILFGLVVLALVALAAVAWLSKPVTVSAGQQPAPLHTAAVSVGARACPSPGTPGSHNTGVAVIAAAARPGPGQATISMLSATGGSASSPLVRLSQPGVLSLSSVPAAPAGSVPSSGGKDANSPVGQPGGVMIQATGSMAQGLAAEQTAAGSVTASCGSPGTDFWFAVPGQQSASSIKLYLMNVDDQASDVDVDVVTDTGPLQGGTDTGITVPPHGLVVQSLAGLVHGSRAIGLHVRTSVGRVVAAVSESSQAGQTGEWLPAAQSPADRLVIPAMPSSGGGRQLYVADPGGGDAAVKLSVVTAGGTYEPTGAGAIDIPAGSASRIELPSLAGVSGAAVLSSNVPVVAAVVVPGGPAGAPGVLTAAAPAIQEQGVVADAGQSGDTTTLVLSATGSAARVRLTTGASGLTSSASSAATGSARVVTIPAKHTVIVKVTRPPGAGSGFAIVLTPLPGSGPVYAGRVLAKTSGTVLAVMPVASALTSVALPAVRDSLMTVAP
jgi:hypothetical protein